MIIKSVWEIETDDVSHFSWTGLHKFQNISFTSKRLNLYHSPPLNQTDNIRKQARQIRYCLTQAEEYFNAARVVSLATKPLLLYYGVMSLALAEILTKQDGRSSLDVARGKHGHHGLELRITSNPSREESLELSSGLLAAVPHERDAGRFGTFELWHRSSRETPWAGKRKIILPNAASEETVSLFAIGDDQRPSLVPSQGFTLLDCFKSLPQMAPFLRGQGITPEIARGSASLTLNDPQRTSEFTIVIHPCESRVIEEVYNRFQYPPAEWESIHINILPSGIVIKQKHNFDDYIYPSRMPFGFQSDVSMIFFASGQNYLNEFGLIYLGLYILGNYSRYYPDQWMADVENCSMLSLAAAEFLAIAERRAPILALSELMQTWHLQKR